MSEYTFSGDFGESSLAPGLVVRGNKMDASYSACE
jgi:hypothetical protein